MGMSASQARYCMISGRKSDVEFEGQQINQQRTTLATETSAYNSQLMGLTVPTAPSSDNYTTTSYTFDLNGNTNTVKGTSYDSDPTSPTYGTYSINTAYSVTGSARVDSLATFSSVNGSTKTAGSDTYTRATAANGEESYSVVSGGKTISLSEVNNVNEATTLSSMFSNFDSTKKYYKYSTDNGATCTYVNGVDLAAISGASGSGTAANSTVSKAYYSGSNSARTNLSFVDLATEDKETAAEDGSNLSTIYGTNYASAGSYYKYVVNGTTRYITADELSQYSDSGENATYSSVNTNATLTETSKITGANITWSSSGRMESITDSNGTVYSLSVNTSSNDTAYNDALNEYAYQKDIYNQSVESINAQIDVIESQDKKLELKLQNLDTQQQALSTEMDSVKKVIDKNIEASFKAFA